MRARIGWVAALSALMLSAGARAATPSINPLAEGPARPVAAPAAPAGGQAALTRTDLESWMDGFLPYALQRGDVAGAVVVVVKDGQVLFEKGYGYADVAKRRPMDPRLTLTRQASVSKLLTWTAVMQLVEQGKLDLDRDVNDYLDFRIPPFEGRPITLRNLMTHTPGFEDAVKGLMTTEPRAPSLERAVKDRIPARIFPPGSTPAYSNYGAGLAGYIVQRVSGERFEDYVQRHILGPLDMAHTTFVQPLPPALAPLASQGYVSIASPPRPFEVVSPSPAGGLSATADDMAKFMIAHLQDGAYGGARILQPQTARMMHATANRVTPPLNSMLLGFYETNRNGRRIIAHAGDTPVFHNELHLFLDDGVGLYISLNSAGKGDSAEVIRAELFQRFTDRYLPGPNPDGQTPRAVALRHAQMAAGLYENSRRYATSFFSALGLVGQTRVVANADGTLTTPKSVDTAGAPRVWREIAPFVWRERDGADRMAARVVDGKVTRIGFDELPFMAFDRPPAWRSSGWLVPALEAALAAFALTAVLWPVVAIVRRRYKQPFALTGWDAVAYRAVRIGAWAGILALAAWFAAIATMAASEDLLSSKSDGLILAVEAFSLAAFVFMAAAAAFNAWRVWRGPRGWFAKLWCLVLLAAAALVLWAGVAFRLVILNTNY